MYDENKQEWNHWDSDEKIDGQESDRAYGEETPVTGESRLETVTEAAEETPVTGESRLETVTEATEETPVTGENSFNQSTESAGSIGGQNYTGTTGRPWDPYGQYNGNVYQQNQATGTGWGQTPSADPAGGQNWNQTPTDHIDGQNWSQSPYMGNGYQQSQQSGSYQQGQQNQPYGQNPQSGSYQPGQQSQPYGQNPQSGSYQQGQQNQPYGQNPQSGAYQQGQQSGPYYQGQPYYSYPYGNRAGSGQPQKPKKKKKKGSIAVRIAGITAAAILFGVVSGGTIIGINLLTNTIRQRAVAAGNLPQPTEPVTLNQAPTTPPAPPTNPNDKGGAPQDGAPYMSMDVSGIVESAMPTVVAINNTMLYKMESFWGPSQTYEVPSSGSGIIVGQNEEELLIVTNNHVVEGASDLSVVFIDQQSVEASIKGTDSDSDLAVIAVPLSSIPAETLSAIKTATIGDSDNLKVGQGVIAIGNALGYGQSVTVGYISALNREVKTEGDSTPKYLLQTDAAINPGNSGGALLNMKGELIGINAAKYSSTSVEGMGYAIPISQAQDIINELMNKKTKIKVAEDKRGYLGIQGKNIDERSSRDFGMPQGVYVYKIVDGDAASKSDLREKDIITKFDGETIKTMANLQDILNYYEAGETIVLTVQSLNNGQYEERTVEVTLGTRPKELQN